MPNRITQKFNDLRAQGRKAFVAFLTAGDPSLRITKELILAFENAGVDIVEVGVPFSDPLADGPTIQESSQRALRNHVNLSKIFKIVREVRRRSEIPLALMTYYNPVFHFGEDRFIMQAKQAGIDGVIIPDLPPEEAQGLLRTARKNDFATVFFLSPTTTPERVKEIIAASTGFIYYVSLTGVTGARGRLPGNIFQNVKTAKAQTGKPICVGFGVSSRAQVKDILAMADGVIVGSAIINQIVKNAGRQGLVDNVTKFVRSLTNVSKDYSIQ